jgi:hypothetical protein
MFSLLFYVVTVLAIMGLGTLVLAYTVVRQFLPLLRRLFNVQRALAESEAARPIVPPQRLDVPPPSTGVAAGYVPPPWLSPDAAVQSTVQFARPRVDGEAT